MHVDTLLGVGPWRLQPTLGSYGNQSPTIISVTDADNFTKLVGDCLPSTQQPGASLLIFCQLCDKNADSFCCRYRNCLMQMPKDSGRNQMLLFCAASDTVTALITLLD